MFKVFITKASQNIWYVPKLNHLRAGFSLGKKKIYLHFLSSVDTFLRRGKQERVYHADVIKWKHFPCNWPFVRGIHRSPVNSPHKGQWRGALMFSLICVWINDWVNNRKAGDLRRYRVHYDVIVMTYIANSIAAVDSLDAHIILPE